MNYDCSLATITANTNEDKRSLTRSFGLIMLAELGVISRAQESRLYRLGATELCAVDVPVAVDA